MILIAVSSDNNYTPLLNEASYVCNYLIYTRLSYGSHALIIHYSLHTSHSPLSFPLSHLIKIICLLIIKKLFFICCSCALIYSCQTLFFFTFVQDILMLSMHATLCKFSEIHFMHFNKSDHKTVRKNQ